jgi:hypothetical protein
MRRRAMSNVYTIHPKKSDLILLYEIVGEDGHAEWGGADPFETMRWFDRSTTAKRILVSAWDSDDEDAHLVGQTIDITDLVMTARL